jgi:3-hydroxyisobutyrate dehydrogenase-like beta-hydroxyacid dehydrogenase
MSTPSVAVIGIGTMGAPIARNLLRVGARLSCFDLKREAMAELVEHGATATASPAEAASRAEFVITMLPADEHIRAAVLAPDGVASGIGRGSILIEMSTAGPATARELEAKLAQAGVDVVDAPVGRGTQAAIDGTLLILASGPRQAVDRCSAVFDPIGERTFYCGDVGAGKTVKLVNNLVFGEIVAAVSEGVTLAVKSGVEPDLVLEVIGNSLAANAVAGHIFPERVLPRDFSPKFRLDLESKDLALAQRLAQDNGAPFLLGALTASLFGTAVGRGLGGSDVSRLAELYEQLGDVTIGQGRSDA